MKVKIPPYPNFKITEEAFERDVEPKSVKSTSSEGLSNQLIAIVEFAGGKRVIRARPVKYQGKVFITAFPNPIHLFLSVAIEHYNHSETVKSTNFLECGKPYGGNVYLLDIEEGGTHECYNHYVKYRASSIIMLVSSIEAFLNHIIPNDFIYNTVRKNKEVKLTKEDIESPQVSFREKLISVIPQWLEKTDFWEDYSSEKKSLLELYDCRKKTIHLKTNSEDDFQRYFGTIDQLLDLDILGAINTSIKFMNLVSEGFVEIEN